MPPEATKQRCTALTKNRGPDGRRLRCRNWALTPAYRAALAHADPDRVPASTLCAQHAGLNAPAGRPRGRCAARLADGTQCGAWALRDSEPPLCSLHILSTPVKKGDDTRCRALTAEGKRCRQWSTRASRETGTRRCVRHSGQSQPPAVNDPQRCTALKKTGGQCRKWAMLATNPPLCHTHALGVMTRMPDQADDAAGRRCTATTLKGTRCRAWSMPHTTPPLCRVHAYPERPTMLAHGYYRKSLFLTPEERARVTWLAKEGEPLAAEIMVMRLKIRRLLAYLNRPQLPQAAQLAGYETLLRALRTVGHLFRAQHELRQAADSAQRAAFQLQSAVGGFLPAQMERLLAEAEAGDGGAADAVAEEGHDR